MKIPAVFKECIDRQMASNRGINLFSEDFSGLLHFSDEMIRLMLDAKNPDPELRDEICEYLVDKALLEFCRVNQFYTFNEKTRRDLKLIYSGLIDAIDRKHTGLDGKVAAGLLREHHQNLRDWLVVSNPFAQKMYESGPEKANPVPCSEYSGIFQLQILSIDLNHLKEPLLDIGCGSGGNLVTYLREQGFDARGFDRFAEEKPYLEKNDWFGFDFGKSKWGTLVSNLAFSHHFRHHHFREDGNYTDYARKYIEILDSLIPGGSFYYAPDLPFIEEFLDPDRFLKQNYDLGDQGFRSSVIKRLK
jgi:hypothetical protein